MNGFFFSISFYYHVNIDFQLYWEHLTTTEGLDQYWSICIIMYSPNLYRLLIIILFLVSDICQYSCRYPCLADTGDIHLADTSTDTNMAMYWSNILTNQYSSPTLTTNRFPSEYCQNVRTMYNWQPPCSEDHKSLD